MIRLCLAAPIGALVLLSACGGHGGNSPSPTGGGSAPTPSPSSAPTPTPTSVSYQKFAALTGAQTFQSACSGRETGSSHRLLPASEFGKGLTFSRTGTDPTWNVSTPSNYADLPINLTFGPSDFVVDAFPTRDVYRKTNVLGQTDVFGYGYSETFEAGLDYVSESYVAFRPGNGPSAAIYCVFGVPTQLNDQLPTVTTSSAFISYEKYALTGDVQIINPDGSRTDYDPSQIAVDFRADPRTGKITVMLILVSRTTMSDGSTTETYLGDVSGEVVIDGSSQNFAGPVNYRRGTERISAGNFGGWFFGPKGTEVGIAINFDFVTEDGKRVSSALVITGTGQGEFVQA